MKFQGGPEEALKILQSLDEKNQQEVLKRIAQKDQKLFHYLKNNLIRLEDLIHLTPRMLADFIRMVQIEDLALALKLERDEVKNFFLQKLPKRLADEINEILNNQKVDISKVQNCKNRILDIIRQGVESGSLIIKPGGDQIIE